MIRGHDHRAGKKPLHLVSAFAPLGQEAVEEKADELFAIPAVLDRPVEASTLAGAVRHHDAIACNPHNLHWVLDVTFKGGPLPTA